jgi:hypothetical protein
MKKLFFASTVALLVAAPAFAQQPAPNADRWQPWLGCWQLLDDNVQDESEVSADQLLAGGNSRRAPRSANSTRVCVEPAEGGVTMSTIIGTQSALEETVVADGKAHSLNDGDCRGSKRSEWSARGHRLYTSAEISCADQPIRNVSSLTMMTPGPTWVDVQMIDVSGRKSIRVRKFMRLGNQPQSRVSFANETAWTVEDVKEASAKLAPETVQAALVELESGFNLSSKQLVSMAKAGVPEGVIDLMIALSYPKKFVVSHPVSTAPPPYGYTYGGLGGSWPWIADAEFWPSYYSPFAYRYWGYYDPYYVPSSGYVHLAPIAPGGGGGVGTPDPAGTGRVVDGRGYTRITTREPEPSIRTGNFGGSNGTFSSGGSGSSGSSSGGNSGASSGGGYSGGSSSGGTGRTAVPRPPGGN